MTELINIKKYEVDWPGWPLSVNHFGDEFDEPARIRMIVGGKRLIPFLLRYHDRLGDSFLEIGPFFNPIMLSRQLQKIIAPGSNLLFLENDPHAVSWLRTVYAAKVIVLDMNAVSFHADFKKRLFEETDKAEAIFSTVLISQVLNYIDFRMLLEQINTVIRPGGLLFINNVIDYGIPPLFSEKRPFNNEDLVRGAMEKGFNLVERVILPKYFQKEVNDRMILVLERK